MAEFEISPEKLKAMKAEHVGNTWLSSIREEAEAACWQLFCERVTPEILLRAQEKVEELGGWNKLGDWIRETPEFREMDAKIIAERPLFWSRLLELPEGDSDLPPQLGN